MFVQFCAGGSLLTAVATSFVFGWRSRLGLKTCVLRVRLSHVFSVVYCLLYINLCCYIACHFCTVCTTSVS